MQDIFKQKSSSQQNVPVQKNWEQLSYQNQLQKLMDTQKKIKEESKILKEIYDNDNSKKHIKQKYYDTLLYSIILEKQIDYKKSQQIFGKPLIQVRKNILELDFQPIIIKPDHLILQSIKSEFCMTELRLFLYQILCQVRKDIKQHKNDVSTQTELIVSISNSTDSSRYYGHHNKIDYFDQVSPSPIQKYIFKYMFMGVQHQYEIIDFEMNVEEFMYDKFGKKAKNYQIFLIKNMNLDKIILDNLNDLFLMELYQMQSSYNIYILLDHNQIATSIKNSNQELQVVQQSDQLEIIQEKHDDEDDSKMKEEKEICIFSNQPQISQLHQVSHDIFEHEENNRENKVKENQEINQKESQTQSEISIKNNIFNQTPNLLIASKLTIDNTNNQIKEVAQIQEIKHEEQIKEQDEKQSNIELNQQLLQLNIQNDSDVQDIVKKEDEEYEQEEQKQEVEEKKEKEEQEQIIVEEDLNSQPSKEERSESNLERENEQKIILEQQEVSKKIISDSTNSFENLIKNDSQEENQNTVIYLNENQLSDKKQEQDKIEGDDKSKQEENIEEKQENIEEKQESYNLIKSVGDMQNSE